jgi:glutamine cyclotransferase
MKQVILYGFILLSAMACGEETDKAENGGAEPEYDLGYSVKRTLEHDRNAFTQGLVFHNNKLLESTGGDSSWIAEYDIETAAYTKKATLEKFYFGEGITVLNNKVYQLTWKSQLGFVYDLNSFERIGTFTYDFEGWGITHDNQHLILSDGTDKLHYFDTLSLTEKFTKSIRFNNQKVSKLNELEFINGYIYANQWQSNQILKIDTGSSTVIKTYDFSAVARENKMINPQADVLNGIAYNPENNDVYITGKLWPFLYVVRFKK